MSKRSYFSEENKLNIYFYLKILLLSLLGITLFISIVPVTPKMPALGLDPSWAMGMNEAVARGLIIGRDIIFTFGPYAAILTHNYHPEIDQYMLFGSLFLALGYILGFLYFRKTMTLFRISVYTILIMLFIHLKDALFISYPLLVAIVIFDVLTKEDVINKTYPKHIKFLLIILLIPLGLLPLIKGTLGLISVAIAGLTTILFLRKGQIAMAINCILIPIISLVFFWLVVGQRLIDLPQYFLSLLPIISGYSDAMSITGPILEIAAYFIGVALILNAIVKRQTTDREAKIYLFFCFLVFFFVIFKAAFIRHDGHMLIGVSGLIMAGIIINLGAKQWSIKRLVCCSLAVVAVVGIILPTRMNEALIFRNIGLDNYNAVKGFIDVRVAGQNNLNQQFVDKKIELRLPCPISQLQGTTDIYSFHQACLLVSDNEWSPRPVFQSYSAYTPKLAQINEAHLLSEKAPDNIIFRVEPIDNRLPSLEDGLSWPLIIKNYDLIRIETEYVLLRKNSESNSRPQKTELYHKTHLFNENVLLPTAPASAPDLLFAEIDIKPTLWGRLYSFLFKLPLLEIKVELENGAIFEHRLISGGAKTGFFITPYVHDNNQFALLFEGGNPEGKVKEISIFPEDGHSIFWKDEYDLKISFFDFQK